MRSASLTPSFQRTNQISQVQSTKKSQDDQSKPIRVKDLKKNESKKDENKRRLFINRKFMSPQYQRNFARLLNSYQLKALRNWAGFSSSINDSLPLNDAQLFILQSARCNQFLYPQKVRKNLINFSKNLPLLTIEEDKEASAQVIDQLILLENYIETILTILAVCRKYDQNQQIILKKEEVFGLEHKQSEYFDLYELVDRKLFRLSWFNKPINIIEKRDIIKWLMMLRSFNDESVNLILIQGLLDNKFNNLTFILDLLRLDDFQNYSSIQTYQILYDFICKTPTHIREMLDQHKFMMSRDILNLLLRSK